MISNKLRVLAAVLLLCALPGLLCSCWDSIEINRLFIVTGVSLDATQNPDNVLVTMQIGKQDGGGGGGSGGEKKDAASTMVLSTENDSVLGAMRDFNRNSDRKLLLQHNRVRLFGIDLARQGLQKHIDVFMRDQQARMEIPLAIVDGKASDILTAKIEQEPISGIFISGLFDDLSKVSPAGRVRMLDFMDRLNHEGIAPILPIIKLVKNDKDEQEIQTQGMGFFREDRLVGNLDNHQSLVFFWMMGDTKTFNVKVTEADSKAILHAGLLKTKRKAYFGSDGNVRFELEMSVNTNLMEIEGFANIPIDELLEHLQNLAQQQMQEDVIKCFRITQQYGVDIFGVSNLLSQKHPKEWEAAKPDWQALYPRATVDVKVKMRISNTGQIVKSLEMEGGLK